MERIVPLTEKPTIPGLYFFTRPNGRKHLVEVARTKGPNMDGNGPLFGQTFIPSRFDPEYFYRAVSELEGSWDGPLDVDREGKPVDKVAAAIIDVCIEAGTAVKR